MRGIKIPQQDFALKLPGGLMREGGVFSGYYGIIKLVKIWPGGTWSELQR